MTTNVDQLVRYAAGSLGEAESQALEARARDDAELAARLCVTQFMVRGILGPATPTVSPVAELARVQANPAEPAAPYSHPNSCEFGYKHDFGYKPLARRLLKLAACVTLILSLSGLAYAGYAWWTAPLFADDFKSGWFDSRKWRAPPEIIKEGGVFPEKGHIRLINRGYLVTNQEFKEPIEVSFEWKWSQLGLLPQYADHITVVLRTSGAPRPMHPFEVQDGLVFIFDAWKGQLRVLSWEDTEFQIILPEASLPLPAEHWHRIRISDDGENVAVYVSGPQIPESISGKPIAQKAVRYKGLANHVAIYNREMLAGIPHEAMIRSFVIRPTK